MNWKMKEFKEGNVRRSVRKMYGFEMEGKK